MVLKFYTHPISPPASRTAVILHELQIPFEEITVDLFTKEQKTPEYLGKNPLGQVPCVDDDGFIVYECRAIARYLCAKYPQGAKFLPNGIEATALFEQMASIETAHHEAAAYRIAGEMYYNPKKGKPANEEIVAEEIKSFNSLLAIYDTILSKRKYLAGDQLTLVDLFHLPLNHLLEKAGVLNLEGKPNVARWWKEISSRPAWKAVKFQD